jgi:SAM-dependent methyltransferase
VCGHYGRFFAFGQPPRFDAHCPKCGSLERHRLLKLWLDRNPARIEAADILHFAPESGLAASLAARAASYASADLRPGRAERVLNIESIALDDAAFSMIVCVHVLEHVDDRRALDEIFRILRPDGLALIMVPVIESWDVTYEDRSASTHSARSLYFGQSDHVRFYGRDLRERLSKAGFAVDEFVAAEPDVSRHGLMRGETLFICRKPHAHETLSRISADMRAAEYVGGSGPNAYCSSDAASVPQS